MPHLRMEQAVQQPAVDHAASTDARADGQVNKILQALRGAPGKFTKGRGIDIGIDINGNIKRLVSVLR